MASNKVFRSGPIALTNTYTTNLINPATTTGGVNGGGSGNLYIVLKHLQIINVDSAAHTFRFYIGATGANAAGTELRYDTAVSANDAYDIWSPGLRLDVADFLVGGADANSVLILIAEGEIGVA